MFTTSTSSWMRTTNKEESSSRLRGTKARIDQKREIRTKVLLERLRSWSRPSDRLIRQRVLVSRQGQQDFRQHRLEVVTVEKSSKVGRGHSIGLKMRDQFLISRSTRPVAPEIQSQVRAKEREGQRRHRLNRPLRSERAVQVPPQVYLDCHPRLMG